ALDGSGHRRDGCRARAGRGIVAVGGNEDRVVVTDEAGPNARVAVERARRRALTGYCASVAGRAESTALHAPVKMRSAAFAARFEIALAAFAVCAASDCVPGVVGSPVRSAARVSGSAGICGVAAR